MQYEEKRIKVEKGMAQGVFNNEKRETNPAQYPFRKLCARNFFVQLLTHFTSIIAIMYFSC